MQTYLKVKIKTLASEAQIIRKEERKAKTSKSRRRAAKRAMQLGVKMQDGSFMALSNMERDHAVKVATPPTDEQLSLFFGLQSHRKGVVRGEARATQLAYGFLRGLPYFMLETSNSNTPEWDRIETMVKKYGTKEDIGRFSDWKSAAEEHLSQ